MFNNRMTLENKKKSTYFHLSRNKVIFINLIFLGIWFWIFYHTSFFLWESPSFGLDYSLKAIWWASMIVYPFFIIFGVAFTFLGKNRTQIRLLKFGILVPLFGALLFTILFFMISPVNNIVYRANPPNTIADIASKENKVLSPSLDVNNVFFVLDSVTFDDIITWNGTLLIYTTDLSTNTVMSNYSDFYAPTEFTKFNSGQMANQKYTYYENSKTNTYICLFARPIDNDQVQVYLNHTSRKCD